MKDDLFAELMQSATEALEHARGKRDLRTTILPEPPKPMKSREIRRLRERVHASQAVFASGLNVSTKLVQAWEADRRTPEGSALRLLRLAENYPALVFGTLTNRESSPVDRKQSSRIPAMQMLEQMNAAEWPRHTPRNTGLKHDQHLAESYLQPRAKRRHK